jgi:enediyne biosynthesis protein E4
MKISDWGMAGVVLGAIVVVWTSGRAASGTAVVFTDASAAAGIKFVHNSGRAGQKYLPETMGAGGGFGDFNGDGRPDLFLVNGRDWKPKGRRSLPALYKNNGNGTFTNVTAASGLDVELYGMGVAIGDYDNDGRDDIYVTALEGDRLFHNEGNFKFRDVTKAARIANANFGTSAAWLDYDRDGRLDLFVANYVQWSADKDLYCTLDGTTKSYCTPESYKGTASKLFHNLGAAGFEDVSQKAGVADPTSKSLGVAIFDYDADGWPDVFVANDTQPNKLYRNNHNGTFTEKGVAAGVAFSEDGVARGAMGADIGDYDGSGRLHLLVGNFANQMLALYRNEGNGLFVDEAPASTVGRTSLLSLTFGVFFFDYDLDGHPDIFAANGHIEEEIGRVQPKVQYKQIPLMFRNLGKGRFESVGPSLGPAFNVAQVARGAAYADVDGDGDLDILITTNHGPARLLRNDGGNKNHWLTVRTAGTKSNRDGIGAIVRVEDAAGTTIQTVHSGSSYCSQSDLALTFGLGANTTARSVVVEWPSGTKDRVTNVAADRTVTIREGAGILR